LSQVFRGKFVAPLREERSRSRLAGEASLGDANWRALPAALYRHAWVVYARQSIGGPAQVLDYLARHTHKVAISNHRSTGLDDGAVTFRLRDSQSAKVGRSTSLPAEAFIGRFLSHVLPSGFKRSAIAVCWGIVTKRRNWPLAGRCSACSRRYRRCWSRWRIS